MSTRQVVTIEGGTLFIVNRQSTINSGAQVFTVPAGKRWILQSYTSDLICSATVGNRTAIVFISDDIGPIWMGEITGNIAASQTGGYDISFGKVGTPSTTVRRNLANTANTNVQVRTNCPVFELDAGCTITYDDLANIDNTDVLNHVLVYRQYEA